VEPTRQDSGVSSKMDRCIQTLSNCTDSRTTELVKDWRAYPILPSQIDLFHRLTGTAIDEFKVGERLQELRLRSNGRQPYDHVGLSSR
jgi:hypothetical protein